MSAQGQWLDENQRALTAALASLRAALEAYVERGAPLEALPEAEGMEGSALDTLCALLDLTPFERALLLLCAGVELDGAFAALCAAAQPEARRAAPTFGLALAALPGAHWSALAPDGPLRRWRLVELGAGEALVSSPLRIDERILHYLTGIQHLDENLAGFAQPLPAAGALVPSHRALAEEIVATWLGAGASLPVVQLVGGELAGKRDVMAAACALAGLAPCLMRAHLLPTAPAELDILSRLWEREALLGRRALLLDCDDLEAGDRLRQSIVAQFIEEMGGVLVVASRERWQARHRPIVTVEVNKPSPGEQRTLWEEALGPTAAALNGRVEELVAQFDLSAPAIQAAATRALGGAERGLTEAPIESRLWLACRAQARPQLDDLAQRIEPRAGWDDLILPERQKKLLREIALHVRQRARVYEGWGFAARSARGLGISALFAGTSGTGKTMAAEVLANELSLDLYRIDLSQVVSKYIGETEKNLRRVFDAAEEGGAILLFDEADALFGKRSEVKDSHDRYANIEVSYLLQRMESYRGLAILTTNMKNALDEAFTRRLRFIVPFPFPDAQQRAAIWRGIFPAETPTEGLAAERLAQLNVAGGAIRNIALNAAFLAAEAGAPVGMAQLLQAARHEYGKLEKPLTDIEIRGWQ